MVKINKGSTIHEQFALLSRRPPASVTTENKMPEKPVATPTPVKARPRRKVSGMFFFTSLLLGSLLLAIAVPPWELTVSMQGAPLMVRPAGHAFLLSPPDPPNQRSSVGLRISVAPYLAQIAVPFALLAILNGSVALHRRKTN